jgi:hypothetical protein
MVFTSLNPARETYRLWHRFRMPTAGGSKDAVAVSQTVGDNLVSAYTFMLEHIVLLVWGITVVASLLISAKRYEHTHPNSALHPEIWHRRSSPYDILKLAFKHFLKPKSSRWFILVWLLLALSFVVVKYAVPIIFSPYIKIAYAAPVAPDAIYFPSRNGTDVSPSTLQSNVEDLQIFELLLPSALRAAGGVDGVNATFKGNENPPVKVDQPEILGIDADGEISLRINYGYTITGVDLGLQNNPDLTLNVEGSCMTEYGWWVNDYTNDSNLPGAFVEQYSVFNSSLPELQSFVSKYDGGPPIAYFFANPPADAKGTNGTWAAIISTVNRSSYTVGNDPWYRTGNSSIYAANPSPDLGPYMVLPQRPALSCWENDVWSYGGNNGSIATLESIPGLNMPIGLQTILTSALGEPMIVTLGSYLRESALKSSFTAVSDEFDANSSTIYTDLQRLVFASYIASVNTLTETTLFSSNDTIANAVTPGGVLLPGTSEFVIFSNDVVTLSVRALIIVPTIAALLWIVFFLLTFLPMIAGLIESLSKNHEAAHVEEKDEKDESTVLKAGKQGATAVTQILANGSNTSIISEIP